MDYWWIWVIASYLAGSIPFALLIGFAHGTDIREHGSGNVGATNCGRVLGKKWFFVCFTLDVFKGALPVLGAGWAMGVLGKFDVDPITQWKWLAVAAAAPLGHVLPVWLRFKGGKGVATGFGVLLGMFPVLTVCAAGALVVWGAVVLVSRYVGLASSIAALSLPGFVLAVGGVRRPDDCADAADARGLRRARGGGADPPPRQPCPHLRRHRAQDR